MQRAGIAQCRAAWHIQDMAHPIDISRLTPQERIELAEDLWDSLTEEDIELTDDQLAELERRRDRLDRDGPRGRPWRQVFDELDQHGE